MVVVGVIYIFAVYYCTVSPVEGAQAETGTRLRGGESQNLEGVRGLKALGVRDLHYRMAYLACTVIPCNNKVTSPLHHHSLHVLKLLLQCCLIFS